jgi:hypothetical protein
MRITKSAVLCATLFLSGCHHSEDSPNSPTPVALYPLTSGSSWAYDMESTPYNFRLKDSADTFRPDTVQRSITALVMGDTSLTPGGFPGSSSVLVATLQEISIQLRPTDPNPRIVAYQFYSPRQTSLFLHGYRSGSAGSLPKNSGRTSSILLNGHLFRDQRMIPLAPFDSITREIPPKEVLHYPLATGTRWTFRPNGAPFRIDKEVMARTTIAVAGASYDCAVVQYFYDIDNNGTWDTNISIVDLVSDKGLLKRSIDIHDLVATSSISPADTVALFDVREEYIATSVAVR